MRIKENSTPYGLRLAVIVGLLLVFLTLTACAGGTATPSQFGEDELFPLPTPTTSFCEACAQATLGAVLTQEQKNIENQAAATAEIARANAQATLNSANATLIAVQTLDQSNANFIAAQIAATAAIERANAQATLNSSSSTQIAALTQSQYDLQVTEAIRTQSAGAFLTQQNKDELAAGTQTAISNDIATQTRAAEATSQWYADQELQREENRQGPIAFLWTWCFPIFVFLLAGLILWGLWLLLQARSPEKTVEQLPPVPPSEILDHHHHAALPYIESDVIEDRYQLTTPEDQVHKWMDEVKEELLNSEEQDQDDNSHN